MTLAPWIDPLTGLMLTVPAGWAWWGHMRGRAKERRLERETDPARQATLRDEIANAYKLSRLLPMPLAWCLGCGLLLRLCASVWKLVA